MNLFELSNSVTTPEKFRDGTEYSNIRKSAEYSNSISVSEYSTVFFLIIVMCSVNT